VKIAAIPGQANGKKLIKTPKDSLYRAREQMLVNNNSAGAQFAHYFRTAKSLLLWDEDRPRRCSLVRCARCSDQLSFATLHLLLAIQKRAFEEARRVNEREVV
jgi:protein-disulfide isomerase-like protein with CxxC motif